MYSTNEDPKDLMPQDLDGLVEVMSPQFLQKLRDVVKPQGKKGTWLRFLNDARLAEVYHRLKSGQSPYRIVKIAQNEWGIKRDSDQKSLARAVRTFRDAVVGDLVVDEKARNDTKDTARSQTSRGKRIIKKLDGMERLAWLVEVETERLETLVKREKTSLPFKFTDKTVKTLGELINMYIKFQIELGLIDSVPTETNLNVRHQFEGIMQNTLEHGGQNMMKATSKFMELAERHSLTLEMDDEGNYSVAQLETSDATQEEEVPDTAE